MIKIFGNEIIDLNKNPVKIFLNEEEMGGVFFNVIYMENGYVVYNQSNLSYVKVFHFQFLNHVIKK
jgi:hypothetical protein